MEIRSRPIRAFRIGSDETRFGPLQFVGGLEMTSYARDFGSLSGFSFTEPGTSFAGVSDNGFWYFGRVVHDAQGRPLGLADFSMQPMLDKSGDVIGEKWFTDAEGIAVRGDVATVSFEREHKLAEFRLAREGMGAELRSLPFLIPAEELRRNKGIETIAIAPDDGPLAGARVVISERSIDTQGNVFATIIEGPQKGIFKVARKDAFDITDGAFLPDGDLLVLERSFSVASGVAMRLRRLKGESVRPGMLADGPVLLTADMSYQIDNMEGLDVWRRADGATMVSIVSDDNHSILQRNLYLEFRLDGE